MAEEVVMKKAESRPVVLESEAAFEKMLTIALVTTERVYSTVAGGTISQPVGEKLGSCRMLVCTPFEGSTTHVSAIGCGYIFADQSSIKLNFTKSQEANIVSALSLAEY